MDKDKTVLKYFPSFIREVLSNLSKNEWDKLNEISLICNKPLSVQINGRRYFLGNRGCTYNINDAFIVKKNDVLSVYEQITKSSSYSYSRFIKDGFLTIENGHRVGIAGNFICNEYKAEKLIDINSLSFRIPGNSDSNADLIFDDIYKSGIISNTIIVSPPGCGKTTLLRNLAAKLSSAYNKNPLIKSVIIDERFEIASCFDGVSTQSVGALTAVISGCYKKTAIPMAVRSMSPDVILTDEVATDDDVDAIKYAKASGCAIIATTHGFDELNNELMFLNINDIFDKIIVLSKRNGPGTIEKIIGGKCYVN